MAWTWSTRSENRRLYETIAKKGLLISEFPMGAPAFPQNFPIRNRIVSGLSDGVLIIEGAQYSGSAITARLADRPGQGSIRRPRQHYVENELGPQPADQDRGEAGPGVDRRHQRTAGSRSAATSPFDGQQKILLEGVDAPAPDGEPLP